MNRNRLTAIRLLTNVFSISTRLVGNAFLSLLRYQSETCFSDAAGSGPAPGKRHFEQLRLRGHCRRGLSSCKIAEYQFEQHQVWKCAKPCCRQSTAQFLITLQGMRAVLSSGGKLVIDSRNWEQVRKVDVPLKCCIWEDLPAHFTDPIDLVFCLSNAIGNTRNVEEMFRSVPRLCPASTRDSRSAPSCLSPTCFGGSAHLSH